MTNGNRYQQRTIGIATHLRLGRCGMSNVAKYFHMQKERVFEEASSISGLDWVYVPPISQGLSEPYRERVRVVIIPTVGSINASQARPASTIPPTTLGCNYGDH